MNRVSASLPRLVRSRGDFEAANAGRRMRRLILGFALVAPFIGLGMVTWSVSLAVGIVVLSHVLLIYPTLVASSQWLGPVVTRFATDRKEVWLTIDDGPDPIDTPRILEVLQRYGGRATFFVKGERVRRYPVETDAIIRQGHTLGNHSHTHPSARFWCLSPGRLAQEIDECNQAIFEVTGHSVTLFRAPVGMKNPFVHPLLDARGMRLIGWSARGFDAVGRDSEAVVNRICRDIDKGAIILAHEGKLGQHESIESLIGRLSEEGYSFIIPTEDRFIFGGPKKRGEENPR